MIKKYNQHFKNDINENVGVFKKIDVGVLLSKNPYMSVVEDIRLLVLNKLCQWVPLNSRSHNMHSEIVTEVYVYNDKHGKLSLFFNRKTVDTNFAIDVEISGIYDAIGFPSGEVIQVPKEKLEILIKMDLIKYLEYVKLENGSILRNMHIFHDNRFENIMNILNPNKIKESEISDNDLEDHEIDDEYHIRHLYKKKDNDGDGDDTPFLQIVNTYKNKARFRSYDQLLRFSCSNHNVTSLDGIEKLINLEYFDCSNNKLTSLKGIENLVHLREIECFNNQLINIESIKNLKNIRAFSCFNNKLTNLDGIEKLNKLEILSCGNNIFSEEYTHYLKNYCIKKNITLYI